MKTVKQFYSLLLVGILCQGCIGTDLLDVEITDPVLRISFFPTQLQVADSFQLQFEYRDSLGSPANRPIAWISSDTSVASINEQGLLIGLDTGQTIITAVVGNATDQVMIQVTKEETIVAVNSRTGSLMGRAGYRIMGNFTVSINDEKTILTIINAQIDNTAPGPVYYLGNSKSSIANALRLGVANSGDQTYELPENITITTYDLLIVWCDPFNVLLGYGEFKD